MKACKRSRIELEGLAHSGRLGYVGYKVGPEQGVGVVRYSDLSPAVFFQDYVAPRRPVVIDGCLPESEGWLAGKWTNGYLREKAGDAEVKVEWRADRGERFGRGQEKPMKFGDFLSEVEKGSELLYLTTQDLGVDASGRPKLMSAPLDKLKGDFPLRPPLAGGLVPQNVNLWMGNSRGKGSSSGLHHDFHDNLYILLRGKKTFRLYSPADAHRMYLQGNVVKVHPNGRINYEGRETLADGADPLAESAARAAALVDRAALKAEELASKVRGSSNENPSGDGSNGGTAGGLGTGGSGETKGAQTGASGGSAEGESGRNPEKEVEEAQAAVDRGEEGAAERLERAEEELERALEAVLDAECADGAGFGDGGDSENESSDSDGGPGFFDGINDNPTSEEFARVTGGRLVGDAGTVRGSGGKGGASSKGEESASRNHCDDDDNISSLGDAGNGDDLRNGSAGEQAKRAAAAAVATADGGGSVDGDKENDSASPSTSPTTKKKKRSAVKEDGSEENVVAAVGGGGGRTGRTAAAPSNFSRVDPSLPVTELEQRFPMFLEAEACTVEVHAGQMLFLPAGWFHEVTSLASEDGHMAFNYWFHPPDALAPSRTSASDRKDGKEVTSPYTSSFWQNDWEARLQEGDGEGAA